MTKAIEIKNELDNTTNRLTELETELDEQTSKFEAVQSEFIKGEADIDRLHTEQQKVTLLAQAIEALRATAGKLKASFGMQSEAENRRQTIKIMAESSNQVEPLLNDYLKSRDKFNDIIAKYAATLIEKRKAYQDKQLEYKTALTSLDAPVTDAESRQSGLDAKACELASRTFFNNPPVEFDRSIVEAENLLAAKLNEAARRTRRTASQAA